MTETVAKLTDGEFLNFIKILTELKQVCNDLHMVEGIFRQRTNNHTSVFLGELPYLKQIPVLALTNVAQKLNLLKMSLNKKESITLTLNKPDEELPGAYEFRDEGSGVLSFNEPTMEFMDNKFMTEQELESIFPATPETLILDHVFTQADVKKIKNNTHYFSVETLVIDKPEEDSNKCMVVIQTPSHDQKWEYPMPDFKEGHVDGLKFDTNISNVAFAFNKEVYFRMYKDPTQNVALNLFTMKYDDVSTHCLSRSQMIEFEEE